MARASGTYQKQTQGSRESFVFKLTSGKYTNTITVSGHGIHGMSEPTQKITDMAYAAFFKCLEVSKSGVLDKIKGRKNG